jgi:hypothetical protein
MLTNPFDTPRGPRSYVLIDLESAVLDDTAHRRYQQMERWTPTDADQPSRRGYTRSEDPLQTPRWVFQTITTAAIMVMREHIDGGIDVAQFTSFSAPEQDERGVLTSILKVLADAPADAELVTYGGAMHDVPLIVAGCMRHGLSLPSGWKWMAFGGGNAARNLDLARHLTGGFKMKPIHMAEVLAAMDLPGKITAPPFAIARMIYAKRWGEVKEACEVDVISTALLLARWKRLHDPRLTLEGVEDRLLRRVVELMPDRSYVAALQACRDARFSAQFAKASDDAVTLAPWLEQDAA